MLILALILVLKPPYPHAKADTPLKKKVVEKVAVAEPPVTSQAPQPQPAMATEQAPVTVQTPSTYHSDDFYMEYIFQHESSGNPYAVNGIGCVGLGQACPASKLTSVCPNLGDVACQVQFFTNYAVSRYGSWANAYSAWISQGWW